MASLHEYPVHVVWEGGRDGKGEVTAERSGTKNTLSVPPEFQGPGNGTNPEELLSSSLAACYSMTFGIIAANQKLPVHHFECKATGIVEQNGATFTYKEITVRPVITLAADATDEQVAKAHDMAHKADSYCIITNAVRGKVEIKLEPTVNKA